MHNWQEDAHCTIKDDIKDCQEICNHLGLTLDIINFQAEYRQRVFNHCLKLFKQGLTPNPDILCNSQIKFDVLKKHCLQKKNANILQQDTMPKLKIEMVV